MELEPPPDCGGYFFGGDEFLKRLECANARSGKPLPLRKRGRRQLYCSDACRKAASRETTQEQAAGDREMVAFLRGFIGQLWPVYAWDDSPRIMALIVPRNIALDELRSGFNLRGERGRSQAGFIDLRCLRLRGLRQTPSRRHQGVLLDAEKPPHSRGVYPLGREPKRPLI